MQYFGASVLALLGLANSLQCTEVNGGHNTWSSGPRVRLEVHPHIEEWPHSGGHPSKKLVLHKKNEPLNMTCTVVHQDGEKEDTFFDYIVDWKGPRHITNNPKIETGQSRNMAWIWFERLAEKDAGDYSCMAVSHKPYEHQSTLSIFFYLFVEHKPTYCGPQWYRCLSKNCIMERYVCDGKKDCEEGEDESSSAGCGDDPCHGKILCEDRCIPAEWCCDHRNCSGTFGLRPWPHENHEISYVQTAFYTVIGCAMAFMFIVTILVIAICRVQIKRAMNSRCTQQNRNPCARRTVPLYDLDVYLNRTADVNYPGGVSIMYNINSGVQFVGRPAEPPPYSAVVAEPPREGPPPPYASCENLIVRQLNPRFIEGAADATSAADANPSALGINQSIAETGAIPPDTDIRGVAAQSNISTNGQRESLLPNVPGPQVAANHATCITQPRAIDSRDVFTAWAASNALHSRDSVDAPLTVTAESPRTRVQQPPPNFELEYVETDALLAENASNNPAIQSSKNIVWKPYSRHALMKSRWLNNARSDKTPEKHWYRQRVEKAVQECPSRGRDVSTSRDSENEGVFLDTDQQDSTPAESTSSAESDIAAGFAPFVDIVDAPKASCDKVNDNVAPSCSKAAAQSDVDAAGLHAQDSRRESLLAEHNANLKALKSEAKASRKEKCKSEVISDRASQVVPADKSFRRAIKRQSSLTSEEIRSKNLSESSASASAGNVNAASSRVADNEGNNKQIREVSSLVLPLRESFIGVQRDS